MARQMHSNTEQEMGLHHQGAAEPHCGPNPEGKAVSRDTQAAGDKVSGAQAWRMHRLPAFFSTYIREMREVWKDSVI